MALTPQDNQNIELIVQQFKEAPHFPPYAIVDTLMHGQGFLLQRACSEDDDGIIDDMEGSLLTWFYSEYLPRIQSREPNLLQDVIDKLYELRIVE